MKFKDLLKIVSLLITTSLMSGCGTSGSDNPPNIFNGAVFISDRAVPGTNELFIVDSDATAVTKLSSDILAGNVKSFLVSPRLGFITYLADQDNAGTNELYFIKNNGDTPQSADIPIKINTDLVAGRNVSKYEWSPNGLFMAYLADQDTFGVNELYISDARTVVKVSPTIVAGNITDIKWSPDSNNIAFKAPVAGKDELYVSKADGSVIATQVSDSTIGAGLTDFEWSPDSSLIAYLSDQDNAGVIDLYTTADNVLASTKVTDVTTGSVQAFRWPNLNSSFLAYSATTLPAGGIDLYVTELALSNALPVSNVIAAGAVSIFLWAPNNSLLAYVANQDTVGEFELYTTLPDGSETGTKRSKLITGGGAGIDTTSTDGFIWGAFSNQLIYRAEDTSGMFELFTSTTDGEVTTEGVKISGSLIAGGNVDSDFKLSPFGNAVTYIADQELDEAFELYATDLTGVVTPVKISATLTPSTEVLQHDWSSDGTKVFYVADEVTDGVYDIRSNSTGGTVSLNLSASSSAPGILQGSLIDGLGVTDNLFPL